MKKWIAVYGSHNSGIKTLEECKAWSAQKLAEGAIKASTTKAWICEVKEQVELVTPAVRTVPYIFEAVSEDDAFRKVPA